MGSKTRRQVAALPVRRRRNGGLEVCLVTTRETRRWVIPKGWPEKGLKDWQAAEREAFEEAGLEGRMASTAVGSFPYWKRMEDHFVLVEVDVYVLIVEKQLADWDEKAQRERRWVEIAVAAEEVLEPGLISILNQIDDMIVDADRDEFPGKERGMPIQR